MNPVKITKITVSLFIATLFGSIAPTLSPHSGVQSVYATNPAAGASYYATNQDDLYYQGIDDDLQGADLITALSTLTSTGFNSNSYTALPDIYRYSDVSLSGNGKMQMVYTGTEVSFTPGSMPSGANKEHVWPASWYGTGTRTETAGSPGADAHNVWPSASELNSKRGSCAFDELDFASSYKSYEFTRTDWSYGTPGDNDSYVWSTAFNVSSGQPDDALYPARGHRGAIARILMYVATRYRNDTRYPVQLHDQALTLSIGRIGKLSALLKWHYQEPPSAWEIKRNNEVASRWHHNRNPFIDHPEFATRIFYYLPEPGNTQPTTAVKNVIETYGDLSQGIAIDKTSVTLQVGDQLQLSVVSNPNSESITWSSSNPSLATVSQTGLVHALVAGNVTITAQGSSTSASCTVNIQTPPSGNLLIESLSLTPQNATLQVGNELLVQPTISPSNATNKQLLWTSSNTGIAVVDEAGRVIGLNQGSVTITATTSDGSQISATASVNVTPLASSEPGGWSLVKDVATLAAGDKLVIASNTGYTAGTISSKILTSLTSTFSSDKESITTLNAATLQLTLGGSVGAWTLSNDSNQKLGATTVKELAWDGGTTTWTIAISNSAATISSTTSGYGRFLYNVSAPRFTTYTSDTSSSMLLPQLYRLDQTVIDEVQQEAYGYASNFMDVTSLECVARSVSLATWTGLSNQYVALSGAAKDYIYNHYEIDHLIMALVARYNVIIDAYAYDSFITDALGTPIYTDANYHQPNEISTGTNDNITWAIITLFLLLTSISFTITRKKKTYH